MKFKKETQAEIQSNTSNQHEQKDCNQANDQQEIQEVKLFYRNQMSDNHKQTETQMKKIIDNNIKGTENTCVKLHIYIL